MPPRQMIQRMSILIAQVEADIQVWSEQYEKKKKKKKKKKQAAFTLQR